MQPNKLMTLSRLALPAALTLLMALPSAVLALSSNSRNPPSAGDVRDSAFATQVLKCLVTKVEPGGIVHLLPEKAEVAVAVPIDEKVRIRAQNRKEFDGRRKLSVSDLRKGQRLRVSFMPQQERIVSLVVLKSQVATTATSATATSGSR